MAEPARRPQEESIAPDIRPDLGVIDGGGEGDGVPRGKLHSVGGNSGSNDKTSPKAGSDELKALNRRRGDEQSDDDKDDGEGGFYNKDGDKKGFLGRLRNRQPGGGTKKGFIRRNRRRLALVAAASGGIVSLLTFIFIGPFALVDIMKNIEAAGFQRYQVDVSGRSNIWLRSYIELRFGEIDDPHLAPKDRDNLLFRADSVSSNHGLVKWWRTMRSSKFEQDVFERQGIKFTSVAYKDGNIIKFRPGKITFVNTGDSLTFDPSQRAFDAIANGDVSVFNGELSHFVDVNVYQNDKEGRQAIKAMVDQEYPSVWKAVKRWHLRQDIQNMIGVRSWRFFETTRSNLHESKTALRNKIITAAVPDGTKTGAFIKCLFGIPDCNASSDPADPKANDFTPTGTDKQGDKTDGNPSNPQPVGDGTGQDTLSAGSDAAGAATAGDQANKIVSKLIAKSGILSLLDSLSRFDQAIHNHSLSKIITQAKTQQVVGLYTVFSVASDQLTTGQVDNDQVNSFMQQFSRPTNSEGWATVVDPGSGAGKVSADSTGFTETNNKKQFCSEKYQNEMQKPENTQTAENQFQYLCPQDRIGGSNNAAVFEDAWNNGPGLVLHPLLAAFHAVTGGIFDVFNAVVGAITGPIESATLSALGLSSDVKQVSAAAAQQALNFGGANLNINSDTPSGQVTNDLIQGSSAMGEATMRDQGAAATTTVTAALADKNDLAYQEGQGQTSFANRYLALSNPKSLLATQLLAISNISFSDLGRSFIGIFGSALSSPLKALSLPAHAAIPDGYAAAKFAGIETFDMPAECLNADPVKMTPQDATNAVQLGIFKPDELNWDMMSNKQTWYTALYAKIGDNETLAKKVWNCALFDNTVRSGMSAQYGYTGEDAYGSDSGTSGVTSTTTQATPPPTTPQPASPPTTACSVDDSAAPDLAQVATNIKSACEQNFSKIEALLSPSLFPAPHPIVFTNGHGVGTATDPANTQDATVYLSIDYFRQNPSDIGVIVHEETHVVQGYGAKSYTAQAPKWLMEGMADWVRNRLGYTDSSNYVCTNTETYLSGYNCAAVFLDYVSKYDSSIVQDAHNAIRQGSYSDSSFFKQKTGYDLTTLYGQCLANQCAGGKRI